MSRMSDLYLDIEEIVIDAVSTPGIMYDQDVYEYVNARSPIPVDMETIEYILDKWFADDLSVETRVYN